MAILDKIKRKQPIIDYRSPRGGFYIAKCDYCGREYYPKRKTSKYCCSQCGTDAYNDKQAKKRDIEEFKIRGTKRKMLVFFGEHRLRSYMDRLLKADLKLNTKYIIYPKEKPNRMSDAQYRYLKKFLIEKISSNTYILTKVK